MDMSQPEGKKRTVAAEAAANVDGYLRNASKRLRIPSASGGRGTRRKLAMVTATNVDHSSQTVLGPSTVQSVDLEDEWDEVVLPNAAATVGVKADEVKVTKAESMKAPKADVTTVLRGDGGVKTEALQVEEMELGNNINNDNASAQSLMEGTRPPLSGTPVQQWGRRDPAYSRMLEEQEQLAAQRRAERIRRAAEGMCLLIFALQRGKLLVRESHHPKLVRKLLQLRIGKGGNDNGDDVCKLPPLLHAVQRAKESYQHALDPTVKKCTLSPSWVTVGKDTVKNYTSHSIMTLLSAITSVFSLDEGISDVSVLSNWAAPISSGYLFSLLSKSRSFLSSPNAKMRLPHSLYFCVIFLSLASVSGMPCRLVMAIKKEREKKNTTAGEGSDDAVAVETPKEMSLFVPRTKKKFQKEKDVATKEEERAFQKLPSSCFWVEVWCPQRESFISVNPCEGCTTLWGAPYTFSIGGDVIVDVTPRYVTKYSCAFSHRLGRCDSYRFFWKHLDWNDSREASEVVLDAFRKNMTEATRSRLEREYKQLHSLAYAEEIPKTLSGLQKHPLFVLEKDLARHEGVYPKDHTTIVGNVKGKMVYKRSAIVNLRSRDGWLRAGRCVISEDEKPYKQTPPSASRPFASPSSFFGVWQTKLFEPSPLRSDGTLPLHGKTRWYVLLDKPAPPGLVHVQQPNIVRVARRMGLEFGLAVLGFQRRRVDERRSTPWEAVINGIVVKEVDAANLLHAYDEWRNLTMEQEAAKRRQRSNRWWLHLSQRMLAAQRIREHYLGGAVHGLLPLR